MDSERVKIEANGKWLGIFEHFGIDVGTGKHKPCPSCGGKDRFRCDNKTGNGEYICGQCGAGDGISLVQKVTGKPFVDILKEISRLIGVVEVDTRKEQPKKDPGVALNKVWKSSTPITGSDPVSKYLHSRKLILTPSNIRYCPKCYESDTKTDLPAMVARIQNAGGKPISLHRTYLNGNGKADIPNPKKTMTPTEPLAGGAIRLFFPGGMFESDTLGVAEGIETAIAATQLYSIATWSTISTSIMEKFNPPKEFKKIVIFADNDKNFSGQVAAFNLAKRLYSENLLVDVFIPPPGDFNDQLFV